MPARRRGVIILTLALALSACGQGEPTPASGGLTRSGDPGVAASPPTGSGQADGQSPATPSRAASPPAEGTNTEAAAQDEPTSTPSEAPSATPTTAKELKSLEDLQGSALWSGLGSAQQAGPIVRATMVWRNLDGIVGRIDNADQLWSQVMPPLRDHELIRHRDTKALPEAIFAQSPYPITHAVHVVTWWTNGPTGTNGRGQLLVAMAGWKDTAGVAHTDIWPILIGKGVGGEGANLAGRILGVGPILTLTGPELPPDQQAAFDQISVHVRQWLDQQPVSQDPLELACPQTGCVT